MPSIPGTVELACSTHSVSKIIQKILLHMPCAKKQKNVKIEGL